LEQERMFLGHYLTHPDKYTVPVLLATGLGYFRGRIKGD